MLSRFLSKSISFTGIIRKSNYAAALSAAPFCTERILKLNDLTYIREGFKKRKRWGRGPGSGRGKMSGHGHQKSRSTPRAFEGGQTPLYKRLPKVGFHNPGQINFEVINLGKLQEYITLGKLVPPPDRMLTMRDLMESGVVSRVREGIKLLADEKELFTSKIHLEVSAASAEAIKTVEENGGTVTCVHFNRLALKALLKPARFDLLPRRARPAPKRMSYYLDKDKSGYLSPEIQIRNLKLFGAVTSEKRLREEHFQLLKYRRILAKKEKNPLILYKPKILLDRKRLFPVP